MELAIEPGVYVVAVSGGVDSVVLLDLLRQIPDMRLVVAHFDHGIRHDSDTDRRLAQAAAQRHGLPFVYERGNLPVGVSEDAARQARYSFLKRVQEANGARAVVTAHHQDDLLETAILNMLRGTGRRGLVSLRSRQSIKRPLLHVPKSQLIKYAKDQKLAWREDSTNTDMRYLRNYVRHRILPRFSAAQRGALLQHIQDLQATHGQLRHELTNHLHIQPSRDQLDRHWFIMLPHAVAKEVLLTWLRRHGVKDISSKTLERVVMAAKTYHPGKSVDIDKEYVLQIGKKVLALRGRER